MENRTESVYECTLAVEAHMICDLLSQAGIAARVDGAFLAGAGGELPLGNTVKVRVAPARVAEAREVIADWEKRSRRPTPWCRPRCTPMLWFLLGAMAGAPWSLPCSNRAAVALTSTVTGSDPSAMAGEPAATDTIAMATVIDERWGSTWRHGLRS